MSSPLPSTPIVLVEGASAEAELARAAIAVLGYPSVLACAASADSLPEVDREARIVLLDVVELGLMRTLAIARSLRRRAGYAYVIGLVDPIDRPLFSELDPLLDDYLSRRPTTSELSSRLRDAERVVRLENAVRSKSEALDVALRRLEVAAAQRTLSRSRIRAARARPMAAYDESDSPLDAVKKTRAWTDASTVIGSALESFLQLSFETPLALQDTPEHATEIALIDPVHELEIACHVTVSAASLVALSRHLMNESDAETGRSLVLEVTNVLMGALRSAFADAGFAFIGSLPALAAVAALPSPARLDRRELAFRTREGTGLGIALTLGSTRIATVPSVELREGMVVRDDLEDGHGHLLARRGTRLSRTSAERLALALPEGVVEVYVRAAEAA